MAETKDDIAAERDALRADNERLRAELARGLPGRVDVPQHRFQLSEGDRQELVQRGVVNIGGRLFTREEVEAKLGDDQRGIDLGDAVPDPLVVAQARRERGNVRGVDYVYPSVAAGEIDPGAVGTPGVSGPAAEEVD